MQPLWKMCNCSQTTRRPPRFRARVWSPYVEAGRAPYTFNVNGEREMTSKHETIGMCLSDKNYVIDNRFIVMVTPDEIDMKSMATSDDDKLK